MNLNKLGRRGGGRGPARRTLAAITAMALVLVACGGDGDEEPADDDGSSAEEPADDDADGDEEPAASGIPAGTYTIGVQALESGPASFAGVPVVQGARMAAEEINESGMLGEGVEIALDVNDAGGDPARAASIVESFAADEDIFGVVCCTISGPAGAVREPLIEAGLPSVTTVALLDGMNDPPYLYRTALLPGQEGQGHDQLVDLILAERDIETAVIANTADSQGQMVEFERWREKLEEEGVEVLEVIETFIEDRDFTGPATQVANIDPDLFLVGMYGDTGALMINAVRARGFEGEIISNYGISGENAYEQGGAAMDGAVFPVPFFIDSPVPEAQEFIERYRERFDEAPDTFAVNGFMAVHLLANGLLEAEEPTREGVAQALASLDRVPGMPVGDLVLENGQATIEEYFMVTWDDGETVLWEP